MSAVAASERLGGREVPALTAFVGGLGLAVDGGLLALNGSTALVPGPPLPLAAAAALVLAGIAVSLLGLLAGGQALMRTAARAAPEMYPFGAPWLQLGLYVLVSVAAAAITHAFLVAYTGADSSGAAASPNGSPTGDALLAAASVVLWALALYAVYGLRRFIQIGRALDARHGLDPFRTSPPSPEPAELAWLPARGPPPAAPTGAAAALIAVTAVVMVEVTVGIQLLETPIGPVGPPVFWWSQLFTLAAAGAVTAAVRSIDRGVRDIELQYAGRDDRPGTPSAPAPAPTAPGFVP